MHIQLSALTRTASDGKPTIGQIQIYHTILGSLNQTISCLGQGDPNAPHIKEGMIENGISDTTFFYKNFKVIPIC